MNIIDMVTKLTLMVCCGLTSMLLNDAFVFWILPSEFFSYQPIFYGFLGNALYSSIILITEITKRAEALQESEKPKNIYWYAMLMFQPIGAALFAFVLTAVIKTMVRTGSIINVQITDGMSVLIGVTAGMFYVYFIKPEFIQRIFNKYIEKKILDDDAK